MRFELTIVVLQTTALTTWLPKLYFIMELNNGIEPSSSAWKAEVLPLNEFSSNKWCPEPDLNRHDLMTDRF